MNIKNVLVVGAGTMGGGIAAHCANVGLSVTLLDMASEGDDPQALVKTLWERQLKARPAALMAPEVAHRVTLGTIEHDLEKAAAKADWIVEVIIEQLAPKQALMAKVDAARRPGTWVTTNTSGIPIRSIAAGRSADFRRHFAGTHFFNPPRYLKLLEVIPTADTAPDVVRALSDFVESRLGKVVVICNDTPNFIANRIGAFVGQYRSIAAADNGYTVEEADVLTGSILGNPKTGTFRLADLVGLDVMGHVVANLRELAPDDDSRELFVAPPFMQQMLERKWLGNKTGQGFYKAVTGPDGDKVFQQLNLQTLTYEPQVKPRFNVIGELKDLPLAERLDAIFNDDKWQDDRGGQYIIETTLPILAYAARRIPEIADTPWEVDQAMRYGFSSEMGPFEMWDAIGLQRGLSLMDAREIAVPAWVRDLAATGQASFYQTEDGGRRTEGPAGGPPSSAARRVYAPAKRAYIPVERPKLHLVLGEGRGRRELKRNASASVLDLGDGVLCFEFHSKGNTLDQFTVDIGRHALELLERDMWRGLVIANQGKDFSLGANIGMFILGAGDPAALEKAARDLQQWTLDFRFAPKPVVTAPRQRVLGGGTEMAMLGARMVAAAETYMGLVEVGVGIIPGLGGCKELLRRVVSSHLAADERVDPLPYLQKVFETIGFAKISESAAQARANGFLSETDLIVANDEHLVGHAKRVALDLADSGYVPPERKARRIYAGGSRAKAAMQMAIHQLHWGRHISDHDALIAGKLAHVLAGGALTAPTWVTEDDILDLEREAFLSLLGEPKTQDRIMYMLKHGKPLRN
jgi:3-hydroxyacyl-CoA dehydrogenase